VSREARLRALPGFGIKARHYGNGAVDNW
jgi:hypothetical protein